MKRVLFIFQRDIICYYRTFLFDSIRYGSDWFISLIEAL